MLSPHGCDATRLVVVDQVDTRANAPATTVQRSATTAVLTNTYTPRVAARPATSTATTGTSTTTTSTSTAHAGCGGVVRCHNHTHCAQCLEAINATTGFPHTEASYYSIGNAASRAYNVRFFRALVSTASCSANATPPSILHAALQELSDGISCAEVYGMFFGYCLVAEYTCFVDPDCQQCVAAVYAATGSDGSNNTKAEIFRGPQCTAANSKLLHNVESLCGGTTFPQCTYHKGQCASLPECETCLARLSAGEGEEAARQCPGSTRSSALAIDKVVSTCIGRSAAACDFWRQRCANNVDCSNCLEDMGNGVSVRAIANDWSSPACQRALRNFFCCPLLEFDHNSLPWHQCLSTHHWRLHPRVRRPVHRVP